MAEKRKAKRHAKHLKVRFGPKGAGFTGTGFTNDISATGLFVAAGAQHKPGTRLHLEVTLGSGQTVFFEGVVARQIVVPLELRSVVKQGFGVRLLSGSELLTELVPSTAASGHDPYRVTFVDHAGYEDALAKELQRGGLFVWVNKEPQLNSTVTVSFDFQYRNAVVPAPARVVHTMAGDDGRVGVALMFEDAPRTLSELQQTATSPALARARTPVPTRHPA